MSINQINLGGLSLSNPSAGGLVDGLANWYSMNEASGDAIDSVGGNNLTDMNTVQSSAGGVLGRCRLLERANSEYFEFSSDITIADNTPYSLSLWVCTSTEVNPAVVFVANRFSAGNYTRIWNVAHNGTFVWYNDANASGGVGSPVFVAGNRMGTWIHYVFVCDGTDSGNIVLYRNGALQGAAAGTLADSSQTWHVFGWFGGGGAGTDFLDARTCMVGRWTRALNAAEVTELYNLGLGNDYPFNAPPSPPSLLTGLVAFWNMTDPAAAAGPWPDAVDDATGLHLTDNNSVTSAAPVSEYTGGGGTGAGQFVAANLESLSIADTTALSGPGDFTVSAWVYIDSTATNNTIASKWISATNQREFLLYLRTSTNRLAFSLSDDGIGGTLLEANSFGAPPTGTWIHVVIWLDNVANTMNIQVNNGAADSLAHATDRFDGTAPFVIGNHGLAPRYWDGRIDAVGYWSRVLTAAERTRLYNSGNGLEYPFVAP